MGQNRGFSGRDHIFAHQEPDRGTERCYCDPENLSTVSPVICPRGLAGGVEKEKVRNRDLGMGSGERIPDPLSSPCFGKIPERGIVD